MSARAPPRPAAAAPAAFAPGPGVRVASGLRSAAPLSWVLNVSVSVVVASGSAAKLAFPSWSVPARPREDPGCGAGPGRPAVSCANRTTASSVPRSEWRAEHAIVGAQLCAAALRFESEPQAASAREASASVTFIVDWSGVKRSMTVGAFFDGAEACFDLSADAHAAIRRMNQPELASAPHLSSISYMPTSVQFNIDMTTLTNGGWNWCYSGTYADYYSLSTLFDVDCTGSYLMLAAAHGSAPNTITMLAWGPRVTVLATSPEMNPYNSYQFYYRWGLPARKRTHGA
jgi:hypothetical protein